MNKQQVIQLILKDKINNMPINTDVKAYAPTNIALCKYWGKRNQILNLPNTESLSISMATKGTTTSIKVIDKAYDCLILNDHEINQSSSFYQRLTAYLDLFRTSAPYHFQIKTQTNLPIAAGLASSASGFAAMALALNALFQWELTDTELSILARLGSGSACRSLWHGFVEWQLGQREDGLDCYAYPLIHTWPSLCIGLLIVSEHEKQVSSREAMQRTVTTSPYYATWPQLVKKNMLQLKEAIRSHHFHEFGKIAESNALAMHSTMHTAWPPIHYNLPITQAYMKQIWQLRADGLPLYFTQDAGPNLKLLFLKEDLQILQHYFPELIIIEPFKEWKLK